MQTAAGPSGATSRYLALLLTTTALCVVGVSSRGWADGGAGGAFSIGAGGGDAATTAGGDGSPGGPSRGGGGGGGAGTTGGAGGDGGMSNGGTGGTGGTAGAMPSGDGGVGGDGIAAGAGGAGSEGGGGGGGGGGAHGFVGVALPVGTATGGAGGGGGNGGSSGSGGAGGGGGAGGWGAVVTGDGALGTLGFTASGGIGGNGGAGNISGSGGVGGSGGIGLSISGADTTFTVNATVAGGEGGTSGANSSVAGGSGGAGLSVTGANTTFTVNSAVFGGRGGVGSDGAVFSPGGTGGNGGSGLSLTGGFATVTVNAAVIGASGGAGGAGGGGGVGPSGPGAGGAGGAGIVGSNLSITNTGAISGGLSGDAVTQADAITFTAGTNSLTLGDTATTGTLSGGIGVSGALSIDPGTTAGNSVTLNNTIHDATNGAGSLTKIGAGTLTLISTSTYSGGTTITAGTLVAGHTDGTFYDSLGSGAVTLNGGTLTLNQFNQTLDKAISVTSAGGGIGSTQGTFLTGAISGSGTLTFSPTVSTKIELDADNSAFTGTTVLATGNLIGGVANAFSSSSAFQVASGAMLNLATNQTVGSLADSGGGGGTVSVAGASANVTLTTGGDNSSTTFSGTISDGIQTLALTKQGTGAFTLSGTSSYTGATTINAGTLTVDGSIAASSLTTVNAGGVLNGTGTVGNTTVAGGVFAPGSGTAGTTQTVNGTLGFSAGGIYRVFVNPAAASSSNITGTATLTGGTANAQFASGSYLARSYTILTAGTRTGTFDALTTNNLPAGFAASLGYATANAVTLDLAMTASSTSGLPPNQQAPANAIVNFFNNGGLLPPGFVTLVGLTGQAQQDGYAQVSGEGGNGAIQTAAYFATNLFLGTMLDPSIDGRGSDEDNGAGASGYAAEESDALAYAGNRKATKATRDAYAAVTPRDRRVDSFGARWSVWATGYGGSMSVDGNATTGTHNTTSGIYGTAVGADYRIGRDTLLGFAMGGAGVNFNTAQGLGGGRADLFQLGAYGRHNFGAAYITGALAYGWQDVTIDRTVTVVGIDRLRANFDTNTFAARAEAGYRFASALMGVTPYGALQVTTFHLPSYAEAAVSGSNQFALGFAGNTATNVRSELGLRADKSLAMRDGLLTLRSRLAFAHDSNTDRVVTPTFQALPGSGAFTVSGARPSPDGALVSAGAEMKWKNGWSVAGNFEGEFSRTTDSYAGKGIVKYAW